MLTTLDPFTARRILAGWSPRAVATAAGVSVRTAYRWRDRVCGLEEVSVGGYRATFAVVRDGPPVRITEWRKDR